MFLFIKHVPPQEDVPPIAANVELVTSRQACLPMLCSDNAQQVFQCIASAAVSAANAGIVYM